MTKIATFLAGLVLTATATTAAALPLNKPKQQRRLLPFQVKRPFRPNNEPPSQLTTATQVRGGFINRRFERFIDKLFDEADTNQDGSISIDETFELVLYMYIKINRQAPIPPPTREKVNALFRTADTDGNKRLSRDEFRRLMLILAQRASTRVLFHKIVKLFVAPLLAIQVVRSLAGNEYLLQIAQTFPEKVAAFMEKPQFWRTVLTVAFVATLGNIALSMVNVVLDSMHLKKGERGKF